METNTLCIEDELKVEELLNKWIAIAERIDNENQLQVLDWASEKNTIGISIF